MAGESGRRLVEPEHIGLVPPRPTPWPLATAGQPFEARTRPRLPKAAYPAGDGMAAALDIAFLFVYVLGAFACGSATVLSLRQASPVWAPHRHVDCGDDVA